MRVLVCHFLRSEFSLNSNHDILHAMPLPYPSSIRTHAHTMKRFLSTGNTPYNETISPYTHTRTYNTRTYNAHSLHMNHDSVCDTMCCLLDLFAIFVFCSSPFRETRKVKMQGENKNILVNGLAHHIPPPPGHITNTCLSSLCFSMSSCPRLDIMCIADAV
jgi:hypothetical protein